MPNHQPESNIRWGILGAGAIAQAFAEDLRLRPGAVLAAVASRRIAQAQAFAERFHISRVHDSIDALTRDPDVDVIYVASPHVNHVEHSLACLAAGKAVLCEKPLALSAAGAAKIADAARRSGRFCMEAMWMRFHPLILEVRSKVQSGALGDIRMLSADFGHPNRFDPESRWFNRALGGGALLDRGVYPLSLAYFLLGPPQEAVGRATIGSTGVDEQQSAILSYSNGALATFSSSLRSRMRNEAILIGTKGMIQIHHPFFAPTRVSHTRFEEEAGKAPESQITPMGFKGRLKRKPLVRRTFDTLVRPAVAALRNALITSVKFPPGTGYQFEAIEVMRCLRAGELESPLMPLSPNPSRS